MQKRPKVLFISSWYPSVLHPTQGNFVQQHILAAQQIADVAVLHVVLSQKHKKLTHEIKNETFETHIVYLPKNTIPILGICINYLWVIFSYLKFARKTKLRKPNIIHANVLYPIGIVALLLKWRWRIPLIFSEHWTAYHPYATPRLSRVVAMFMRWIGNRSNLILPVSLDLAVAMKNFGITSPMKVIPNVVNHQIFNAKQKQNHRIFRFVHISSLDPEQKNFHLLVRAFYEIKKFQPHVELHVVSDGNHSIYMDLIKDFSFANSIHFHGQQDQEGVASILQFADAFVLSSRYENLPCVLIESLACGTPVISTNVGGVAEIVHNQNGILIPSEDLTSLIGAMRDIQNKEFNTTDLHNEMIQKFGPEAISQLFIEAYHMVLSKDVA